MLYNYVKMRLKISVPKSLKTFAGDCMQNTFKSFSIIYCKHPSVYLNEACEFHQIQCIINKLKCTSNISHPKAVMFQKTFRIARNFICMILALRYIDDTIYLHIAQQVALLLPFFKFFRLKCKYLGF